MLKYFVFVVEKHSKPDKGDKVLRLMHPVNFL